MMLPHVKDHQEHLASMPTLRPFSALRRALRVIRILAGSSDQAGVRDRSTPACSFPPCVM